MICIVIYFCIDNTIGICVKKRIDFYFAFCIYNAYIHTSSILVLWEYVKNVFVFCLPLSTKVDPLDFFPTFYNMQSVSSNAVATTLQGYATTSALSQKANGNGRIDYVYFTPRQINDANTIAAVLNARSNGSLIIFAVGWEEYQSYPYAGYGGYFMVGGSSSAAWGIMRSYSGPYTRHCYFTDRIQTSTFSGWLTM
jgi:hypothetical protein